MARLDHVLRRHVLATLGAALLLGMVPAMAADQPRAVVIGQTFLAESLDPAQGVAGWALQSHGVAETLFAVDAQGRIVPQLAQAVTREGEAWRLTLKPALRFSDGTALDATAARDALLRNAAINPRASAQTGKLTIEILSPTELRLTSEKPVSVMASVLAEFPLTIHRAEGERFAYTGPYRPVELQRGDHLTLEPNPFHREPGERPRVVIRRIGDPQSLALALETGEIDIAFNLAAETLARLKRRAGLTVKSTPVAYQYMMFLNTARAPLDDVRVRRALDLAIDRQALIAALGFGEVATGIYPRLYPFALAEPRAHDRAAAESLLDEAGWTRRNGGTREKDGKPLALTLTLYPQRPDFLTLAPVLRAQLEALGLRVKLETTEAITPQLQQRRFDLAFWAMHAAPGGDGAFVMEQYFRAGAALNFAGYASPTFDSILDSLRERQATDERTALLGALQRQLFADAPVSFLMTPVWHVGLSARAADYQLYPSDYHILRADLRVRP